MAVSAIAILNPADITPIQTHRDFLMDIRITDAGGSDNNSVAIAAVSAETPGGWDSTLKATSLGTISGNDIEDLSIPSGAGALDFSVIIQQREDINGEHTTIVYTVTSNAETDTVTMAYADNYDATGGYDRNEFTYGPAQIWIDHKLVGFIADDGVTFARDLEIAQVLSGSMQGILASVITKDGFRIKCVLQQMALQNFLLAWGMQGRVTRSTDINVLGGSRSGEIITLKALDPGIMEEHHVLVTTSNRKDKKTIAIELPFAAVMTPPETIFAKEPDARIGIEFEAHVIPDPAIAEYGKIYKLDRV